MQTDSNFFRSTPLAIALIAISLAWTTSSPQAWAAPAKGDSRLENAHELLGSLYNRSVVRFAEKIADVRGFVETSTRSSLNRWKWKGNAELVSTAILSESNRYGFDPILVMAVIQNESSFKPTAKGPFGEIGLMQLKPTTGAWIAKKFDLPWKGGKTLLDPVMNIRLGAAYLAHLREVFENQSRLYLAAYNMGSGNVHRAMNNDVWPKVYPSRVMQRYVRYYHDLTKSVVIAEMVHSIPGAHELRHIDAAELDSIESERFMPVAASN